MGIRDGGSVFYFSHLAQPQYLKIKKEELNQQREKSLEAILLGINLDDVILEEDIDNILNPIEDDLESQTYNDLDYLFKNSFEIINQQNPLLPKIEHKELKISQVEEYKISSNEKEILKKFFEIFIENRSKLKFDVGLVLNMDVSLDKMVNEIPDEIHTINLYLAKSKYILNKEDFCIPYIGKSTISKNELNNKLFMKLFLEECKPGKADLGMSFFDFNGRFYAGICSDIEFEFKDFFFPMKINDNDYVNSQLNTKIFEQMIQTDHFKTTDKINILFFMYLWHKVCSEVSVRVIKKNKESVIQLERDYLGYFHVHEPYFVTSEDNIKFWIQNFMEKQELFIGDQIEQKFIGEKVVSRSMILVPKS